MPLPASALRLESFPELLLGQHRHQADQAKAEQPEQGTQGQFGFLGGELLQGAPHVHEEQAGDAHAWEVGSSGMKGFSNEQTRRAHPIEEPQWSSDLPNRCCPGA